MHITLGDHHKESGVKVTESILHHEFIIRKDVLKSQNAYHIRRSAYGKLCLSYGMNITVGDPHKES